MGAVASPALLVARRQNAELIALWISHDHPGDVTLADVDTAGTQRQQPLDLGTLIIRRDVEVQPVNAPACANGVQ